MQFKIPTLLCTRWPVCINYVCVFLTAASMRKLCVHYLECMCCRASTGVQCIVNTIIICTPGARTRL